MAIFSVEPGQLSAAAAKLDGLAAEIRELELGTKMSVLGEAIPDTPNCASPITPIAARADQTVATSLSNCGGQVEAFGALVRAAKSVTESTDDFNSTRFSDAGELPSVEPWNPGNVPPPSIPSGN
ncbi:hypothetical protein [Gordonia sp. SL306]|uniref:hypothetical protein n=1 Tax=Gordonia sp. SL306 TaxID=2995145 RepID=UPI002270651B|nr:hypothetical protein [Gordonia sp. SL306]WAC57322.1 hypothetical protein OVA31_08840 [Gordonia sp. SL306]